MAGARTRTVVEIGCHCCSAVAALPANCANLPLADVVPPHGWAAFTLTLGQYFDTIMLCPKHARDALRALPASVLPGPYVTPEGALAVRPAPFDG